MFEIVNVEIRLVKLKWPSLGKFDANCKRRKFVYDTTLCVGLSSEKKYYIL